MSLLKRLNDNFQVKGTQNTAGLTTMTRLAPPFFDEAMWVGNEMKLYPHKNGENIISDGYNINWVVNSCIRHITKMFGKVPFYVVKVKPDESGTFEEYKALRQLDDIRARAEMKRMRKKAIDGIIQDTELSEFLNKPNRNQSGTRFREQLIGYKKMTGEGNTWFNRGVLGGRQNTVGKPYEMFIIPKFVLQLIGNQVDPWEISAYQFSFPGGQQVRVPKLNVMMWIEDNYQMDNFLNHLRGQSPLEAVLLQIQALNEGAIREIKESINGGANGLLYRKDAKELPGNPATVSMIRKQINDAVNGQDVAGTVAWLAGEWGYLPFGKTSQELQRLELSQRDADAIASVLGVPPGLLKTDQKYENAKQFWHQLIYGVIAPEAYSLRDAWNGSLLEMFGLNPRQYQIDCDVLSLPELSDNLKDQVAAVKDANWLSKNEKRIATGYEPLGPEYDIVNSDDMGTDLTNDLADLGEDL